MPVSFRHMVDAAFEGQSVEALLAASPEALQGVTRADADRLREAFGITTIRQLALHRFFRYARALLAAAGEPAYDPGPPPPWEAFFREAPLAHYLQHPSGRFRTAFGPVYYRGRLDATARVLIIGQDPATDELLAGRAFVGRSGQRLQGLLAKIGLNRSYVIVNTFLFGVFGQFDAALRGISLEAPIRTWREALLDRIAAENPLEAVVTIGAAARHAAGAWPGGAAYPRFELVHPAAPEALVLPNWNEQMPLLGAAVEADEGAAVDLSPYGAVFTDDDEAAIPRRDLPFGLPAWHGTGGGRTRRDGNNEIIWTAP